jgi:hypothetical protein
MIILQSDNIDQCIALSAGEIGAAAWRPKLRSSFARAKL